MFRVLIFNINRSMFGKTCSVAKDGFVINMDTQYSIFVGTCHREKWFCSTSRV